jgi:hypothetical protein
MFDAIKTDHKPSAHGKENERIRIIASMVKWHHTPKLISASDTATPINFNSFFMEATRSVWIAIPAPQNQPSAPVLALPAIVAGGGDAHERAMAKRYSKGA